MSSVPTFVVLGQDADGKWSFLGEVPRKRGMTARAARSAAIMEATGGTAAAEGVYAAVLRSEWRIAQDWTPPRQPTVDSLDDSPRRSHAGLDGR
jgi:hypothetical protein